MEVHSLDIRGALFQDINSQISHQVKHNYNYLVSPRNTIHGHRSTHKILGPKNLQKVAQSRKALVRQWQDTVPTLATFSPWLLSEKWMAIYPYNVLPSIAEKSAQKVGTILPLSHQPLSIFPFYGPYGPYGPNVQISKLQIQKFLWKGGKYLFQLSTDFLSVIIKKHIPCKR